ncbi:hypothetical protein K469DRAFT_717531 [Zopfia rhizophila CBS 207.26]|uniref:Uncharacterized protein n=1 Tax=Zopfia rhizophila CBS 207.26 TaxID=1314779 RepID=A0A6A6DHR9_9PEZI|nr:hypothetical protein K469DRAFT_717531 [Zopfia rhizophila CBS 207.26]
MPPIPIHKNDPINPNVTAPPSNDQTTAAKPDGVTPQTANPPPTRTTPASVPATSTQPVYGSSNPPLPQPGARPTPPNASAQPTGSVNNDPPAPQPGYTATHTTTETRRAGPPEQFSIPPPSDAQLAGRSTVTSAEASKPGPTKLNLGPATSPYQPELSGGATQTRTGDEERRTLEHPPGYVQNPDNSPYAPPAQTEQQGDGGVGGAAWNMLFKAGEALRKGEEAAWRAVRNN